MLVAVAAMLGISGCSSTTPAFQQADTDRDGVLSKAEFSLVLLEATFAAADANGDAKITWDEWKAADPSAVKSKFTACDANKDGVVTPAELRQWTEANKAFDQIFTAIDTDGDGKISQPEAKAFHQELMKAEGASDVEKLLNFARQS